MKKLIVFSLVAALCLGLNGCKIVSQVSHFFAQAEDFMFMRDDAQAATGNQGGGSVDPGPHSLTLMSVNRVVKNIRIYSWAVDGQGGRLLDEPLSSMNKSNSQYSELVDALANGSYTLEFTTGQAGKNGGSDKWVTYNYTLKVNGHDLTYLVLVNVQTDGDNVTGVDARLVEVSAAVVPPAITPTPDDEADTGE